MILYDLLAIFDFACIFPICWAWQRGYAVWNNGGTIFWGTGFVISILLLLTREVRSKNTVGLWVVLIALIFNDFYGHLGTSLDFMYGWIIPSIAGPFYSWLWNQGFVFKPLFGSVYWGIALLFSAEILEKERGESKLRRQLSLSAVRTAPAKGKVYDFCRYLNSIGVEAEVISKEQLKERGIKTGVWSSLYDKGGVKFTGLSIDTLLLQASYAADIYTICYLVKVGKGTWAKCVGRTNGKAKRVKIRTNTKTEGFLRKVTGFSWKPKNPITQRLIQDRGLNSYLLTRFRAGMPDIEIVSLFQDAFIGIRITEITDVRAKLVAIRKMALFTVPVESLAKFSTRDDFEAFETIAKHIKETNDMLRTS